MNELRGHLLRSRGIDIALALAIDVVIFGAVFVFETREFDATNLVFLFLLTLLAPLVLIFSDPITIPTTFLLVRLFIFAIRIRRRRFRLPGLALLLTGWNFYGVMLAGQFIRA